MNYIHQYNKLINSRKSLVRCKGDGTYYEKHHIIPKWLGGNNTRDNLILLTAREHYIAHCSNKGKKLGKRDYMTGDNNPSKNLETRLKISKSLRGHKKTPEHLQKLNDVFNKKPKIKCQHCHKLVDYRNLSRWHNDKCKYKNELKC